MKNLEAYFLGNGKPLTPVNKVSTESKAKHEEHYDSKQIKGIRHGLAWIGITLLVKSIGSEKDAPLFEIPLPLIQSGEYHSFDELLITGASVSHRPILK